MTALHGMSVRARRGLISGQPGRRLACAHGSVKHKAHGEIVMRAHFDLFGRAQVLCYNARRKALEIFGDSLL